MPLEQMTKQCLRSRSSYSWGRNSPKVWALSTETSNLAHRHRVNEHRQPTHSKYSRETTGRKPALMPDLCFLPTPRNAGEVSSLPSCLFLNKSSDVLKLCEMGKVGGWGETDTTEWAGLESSRASPLTL